jgi:hypothetical protein
VSEPSGAVRTRLPSASEVAALSEFETELRQQVADAYRALQEAQAEDEPGAIKAYSARMGYLVEIAEEHGVDLAELELSAHAR